MAGEIVTSDKPSNPSPLDPPSRIVCHVCEKQFSQYTCPRCNSRYCSLHCYKSHSTRCTESFMRENVVEELAQMKADDETKQKMMDILRRFHSEENMSDMDDDDDDNDSLLSEETIQKILSGGPISLDDLSPEQRKRFQRAVASGELSKLIKPWDPWWVKPSARSIRLSSEGTQLVQQLAEQETPSPQQDGMEEQTYDVPPGPENPLPSVRQLVSTEPSPLLAVHLVDVLYAYCFTLRLYNGDWKSDATGSAMVVLSVSSVLGQSGQPETVSEVISFCLEQTCSPAYRHTGGLQFGLNLIGDVVKLLSLGTPAIICALCDLQRLFQAGERELKAEKPKHLKRSEIRSRLKLAERKIYFVMCWVHEQVGEAWSSVAAVVEAEKASVMAYRASNNNSVKLEKKNGRGNILIEEME